MIKRETGFEGLYLIETRIFEDDRGYFYEAFNATRFKENQIPLDVAQTNISCSEKDVVRGLHFQNPPFEQGKLVRVISGSVLDVVVDIRKSSSTYGQHYRVELNDENKLALWVPPGFAHGFRTLKDDTVFLYDCTQIYNQESEGAIRWNDPDLNIDWGIENPILSEKDATAQPFKHFITNF